MPREVRQDGPAGRDHGGEVEPQHLVELCFRFGRTALLHQENSQIDPGFVVLRMKPERFLESLRGAITIDPAWNGRSFTAKPERGLRAFGRVYAGWALSQAFYREKIHLKLGYESLEDFLVRDWEASFLRRDAATASVPIIMLTAKAAEIDRVLGLELGADDYMTKPFSPRELLARVRAVLRRVAEAEDKGPHELRYNDLVVDLVRHEVRLGEEPIHLTPREFKLLESLAREPGRAFTRLELLDEVFGLDYEGLERTVDVHVMNLRKKIEPDPDQPRYVTTVPGVGYRFEGSHGT